MPVGANMRRQAIPTIELGDLPIRIPVATFWHQQCTRSFYQAPQAGSDPPQETGCTLLPLPRRLAGNPTDEGRPQEDDRARSDPTPSHWLQDQLEEELTHPEADNPVPRSEDKLHPNAAYSVMSKCYTGPKTSLP